MHKQQPRLLAASNTLNVLILGLMLLMVSACASRPINDRIEQVDPDNGYRPLHGHTPGILSERFRPSLLRPRYHASVTGSGDLFRCARGPLTCHVEQLWRKLQLPVPGVGRRRTECQPGDTTFCTYALLNVEDTPCLCKNSLALSAGFIV